MRRSRHWLASTPISISTMLSQLACLGTKWNSRRISTPAVPRRREGRWKRRLMPISTGCCCGCRRIVEVGQFRATAKSWAVRRSMTADAPGQFASRKTNRLEQLRRYSQSAALGLPRLGRDRIAPPPRPGWIDISRRNRPPAAAGPAPPGIEIEHIFHAGDVIGVDLRDAPHLPAPRRDRYRPSGWRRSPARLVRGQLDHLVREQIGVQRARPAGGFEQTVATSRASSLPVGTLGAPGAGPRSRPLQVAFQAAARSGTPSSRPPQR